MLLDQWEAQMSRWAEIEAVATERAIKDGLLEHADLEHSKAVLAAHPSSRCFGETCVLHNRSDHSMRSFPQHWRGDRGLMERLCPHGIGHPDPDAMTFIRATEGDGAAYYEGIHGCDGCCRKE